MHWCGDADGFQGGHAAAFGFIDAGLHVRSQSNCSVRAWLFSDEIANHVATCGSSLSLLLLLA
eukprot:354208-Chlamydomonas_euryale.AAC.4